MAHDEVRWSDLRAILQDMAERITRIEQHLASSGATGQPFYPPDAGAPGQVAAQAWGIYPTDGQTSGGVPPNIVMLAQSGQLIQAIKQYRELTGIGLKEAKAIVEQAMARGY
jgi:ribosomal protein L7/L12